MSKLVIFIYQFAYRLHQYKIPVLPELINKVFVRLLFGSQIQMGAKIGKNVNLGNGSLGIVIHRHAVLEDNVIVAPNVTIAGTNKKKGAPSIGENSLIATGARILGPIRIGKNCVIGANAVVISDIPDNSLVVGVPGKIIKHDIDITNYRDI
jgi:serine O-acetyltransferase